MQNDGQIYSTVPFIPQNVNCDEHNALQTVKNYVLQICSGGAIYVFFLYKSICIIK